jgi:RNA-directed DNA polymerase
LSIPTMHDRAMQALYLLALDPIAETSGDPNAYGFRTERSPADAMEQCFNVLAHKHAPQWILAGAMRACFDACSHAWLVAHIPMERAILQKWRKAGGVDKQVLSPTAAGVPQGGICSPVIATLALDGLERVRKAYASLPTQRAQRAKVNLGRCADDCIMTGSSSARLEQEIKPLVEQFLRERGLELSPEKTRMTHMEDGFDLLGQHVRQDAGQLLMKPARKHGQAFLGKIRKIVKAHKQTTTANLRAQLNPVIRGWANSHRHVASTVTFYHVDTAIFTMLWSWAKRRHPTKSKGWVAQKYFRTRHGRHWIFFGQQAGHALELLRAGDVPIQRHVKIRGTANPYDPQWEVYVEERLRVKMAHDLKGRRQRLYLWKQQDGLCPLCRQKMTRLTGWHHHHIIWRTCGGSDMAANRVLLHPHCHRQVHSQSFDVAQPRSTRSV